MLYRLRVISVAIPKTSHDVESDVAYFVVSKIGWCLEINFTLAFIRYEQAVFTIFLHFYISHVSIVQEGPAININTCTYENGCNASQQDC